LMPFIRYSFPWSSTSSPRPSVSKFSPP
jgi:hypothetical protein